MAIYFEKQNKKLIKSAEWGNKFFFENKDKKRTWKKKLNQFENPSFSYSLETTQKLADQRVYRTTVLWYK